MSGLAYDEATDTFWGWDERGLPYVLETDGTLAAGFDEDADPFFVDEDDGEAYLFDEDEAAEIVYEVEEFAQQQQDEISDAQYRLAQQVAPIVARLGHDVDKVDAARLVDTYVGLVRGARNDREVEQALERAVRASLPARDELAAVEAVMDRREAERATVDADTREQLEAEGFDPLVAKMATERAADHDTRPLPVDAPRDEVEAIETIMAAREVDAE
jgi:hypothetical protein